MKTEDLTDEDLALYLEEMAYNRKSVLEMLSGSSYVLIKNMCDKELEIAKRLRQRSDLERRMEKFLDEKLPKL